MVGEIGEIAHAVLGGDRDDVAIFLAAEGCRKDILLALLAGNHIAPGITRRDDEQRVAPLFDQRAQRHLDPGAIFDAEVRDVDILQLQLNERTERRSRYIALAVRQGHDRHLDPGIVAAEIEQARGEARRIAAEY